ncbi:MAG: uroporphyrinogen decarboxylase family protein [Syntrophomonadaceae bacterium]|nr:uroporphyrinogen decarboxylase family protein [Syntrophomonadaceae bacterium]
MEQVIDFKCTGDNLEQIPEEIAAAGVSFPKAHTDKNEMARLAKELRKYKHDVITRVPFCVTVEAEALGASVKLGNERTGPRVESYVFNRVEELSDISSINMQAGRIKEVLDCVELLSNEGETVALSVEGPLTIISSLIEPLKFYKGLRNAPGIIEVFLKVLEESVVAYICEGIKRGARIISYGDPVGALDIVGPRVYKEVSGKTSYHILKKAEGLMENSLIHLCGKTSTAFDKMGLIRSIPIEVAEGITYGQAIADLLKQNSGVKFIGHRCIKQTPLVLNKPVLWGISLS